MAKYLTKKCVAGFDYKFCYIPVCIQVLESTQSQVKDEYAQLASKLSRAENENEVLKSKISSEHTNKSELDRWKHGRF